MPGVFHIKCFFEGSQWSGMHGTAECHLTDHTGKSDEQDKDNIRDQKCRAAEFADAVREHPYIGHADRASDTGDDESPLVIKFIF